MPWSQQLTFLVMGVYGRRFEKDLRVLHKNKLCKRMTSNPDLTC